MRQILLDLLKICVAGDMNHFVAEKLKKTAKSRQATLQKKLDTLIHELCDHVDYIEYLELCELEDKFEDLQQKHCFQLRYDPEHKDDMLRVIGRFQNIWFGCGEGHGPESLHSKTMAMFRKFKLLLESMGTTFPVQLGRFFLPQSDDWDEDGPQTRTYVHTRHTSTRLKCDRRNLNSRFTGRAQSATHGLSLNNAAKSERDMVRGAQKTGLGYHRPMSPKEKGKEEQA
ncbi:hypothetical protein IWZ03DRAFT_378296 [Phyllosticta citriasiana]|uniref:Uncharacterized protein n=1 Tax=Phyllosticta citriasiana TaxID=595635 RepID=A0ABR1KKA7_9PEZI